MGDYRTILARIASDEPVDAADVRRAVGDSGLSLLDLLIEMRDVCDRSEWCDRCGERGIKRTSRVDADGDQVVLIICPNCRRPLSKQKRPYVHIQKLQKKLLEGSADGE